MSNRVTLLFSTTPHASRVTAYVIECAYSAWANLIKKVSGTIPTKRIFYFDLRHPLKIWRIRTLWSSTDFSGGLFTNFKLL